MPRQATSLTVDAVLPANFKKLYGEVFDSEDPKAAIAKLSPDELICLRVGVGIREAHAHDVNAMLSEQIAKIEVSKLPSENTVIAVKDEKTKKIVGGLRIETKITPKYSTHTTKEAIKVKEALKQAGLDSTYTQPTVELINEKLFDAYEKGLLPPSISSLLSYSKQPNRVVTFIKSDVIGGE